MTNLAPLFVVFGYSNRSKIEILLKYVTDYILRLDNGTTHKYTLGIALVKYDKLGLYLTNFLLCNIFQRFSIWYIIGLIYGIKRNAHLLLKITGEIILELCFNLVHMIHLELTTRRIMAYF